MVHGWRNLCSLTGMDRPNHWINWIAFVNFLILEAQESSLWETSLYPLHFIVSSGETVYSVTHSASHHAGV